MAKNMTEFLTLWIKTRCNHFLYSVTSKGLFLYLINIPTLITKTPVIPQVFFLKQKIRSSNRTHNYFSKGFRARTCYYYIQTIFLIHLQWVKSFEDLLNVLSWLRVHTVFLHLLTLVIYFHHICKNFFFKSSDKSGWNWPEVQR